MKTTNYKNVVVVAMNNCAVVCNSNKQFKKVMNATDNTVASLQAMKIFLQSVPTNTEELVEEPRLLILGEKSSIKGFATGTNLQYIRTGENAAGKAFTAEQLELIKEVSFLLADRSLNIRVTTDKYVDYRDKEARELINGAWESLKAAIKNQNASIAKPAAKPQAAPAVDPAAAIGLQIAEAAAKGDMDKVMALTAALNALKAAQGVQAPVAEETNEEVVEEEQQEEMTEEEELASLDI